MEGGQATKPGEFTIHAVDPDGHPRNDGGDPFKVDIKGPSEVHPSVTDNGDGTYTVQYLPTEAGGSLLLSFFYSAYYLAEANP